MTRDPVLAALAAASLIGLATLGFLNHSPNRLVSGTTVPLSELGPLPVLFAAAPFVALPALPRGSRWTIPAASAVPVLVLAAACLGADRLPGRVGLGGAFWLALIAGVFATSHVLRTARDRLIVSAALFAMAAAAAGGGAFARLSLAVEFGERRDAVLAATLRHLELSAATIGLATAIGLPLGLLAFRRPALRPTLYGILNILQTIPSIAAFGLLIAPLSALAAAIPLLGRLGFGGIGPAPALIALTLYGLLPIVRNTDAGLASVDPAIRDAAAGMGLTASGRLFAVEMPLAAPALLAGIRIVTVQTIGLVTVAALIGAGGLGTFVFEGVGQYATDLVLLGALPVTAMALLADAVLRSVERKLA